MKGKVEGLRKKLEAWTYSGPSWVWPTVVAVVGILLVVIFIMISGGRMAIVRSNSMDPVFVRGDVAMLEPVEPEEIEEGDIIGLRVPERFQEEYGYPSRVMHRVTEIERSEDGEIEYLRTKGDAREEKDIFRTPPENIIGRHTGTTIPYIGLIPLFARTTTGMLVLSISFMLIVTGSYLPWHMTRKEERSKAMTTLGGGLDTLHRRLTDIEDAVGNAAGAVSDSASGLIVSRTANGNIDGIKQTSSSETEPENIMMKRQDSDPSNVGVSVGKPESREEKDKERDIDTEKEIEDKKEIDLRPLDELDRDFQKGDISVDEYIDMRKGMSLESEEKTEKEKKTQAEIDLRPLNDLHKKFQRGDISAEEFIEIRKELKEGRKDD